MVANQPSLANIQDLLPKSNGPSLDNIKDLLPQQPQGLADKIANSSLGKVFLGAGNALGDIPENIYKLAGLNIPNPIPSQNDPYFEGGQYLGGAEGLLGGGEVLDSVRAMAEGLPLVGKIAASLGGGGWSGVGRRALGGAGYGALTNPDNRTESAVVDAFMSPFFDLGTKGINSALGTAFGGQSYLNRAGNKVLEFLKNKQKDFSALSPEETAQNVGMNYTKTDGSPMNVDIGTATNNPTLQKIYNRSAYIPGSGAAKNINQLKGQISQKNLEQASSVIIPEMQNNSAIKAQLANATQDLGNISEDINKANPFLNSLIDNVPDKTSIGKYNAQAVLDAFKSARKNNSQLYKGLDSQDIRLENNVGSNNFPNYHSAAVDLLTKKENLNNLFGNDSDMSGALHGELNKAQSMIDNQEKWGVTLDDARERIKNLGRIASAAASSGNRNEARLISTLRDGLAQDVDTNLRNSGRADIADKLQTANQDYQQNILPFYNDNEVRKLVTTKQYIPQQQKLAKALHDPNNSSILNKLGDDTKKQLLYPLITGGKGASSGSSSMQAEQIASAYQRLPQEYKSTIAGYMPNADQYFELLAGKIAKQKELSSMVDNLSKQSDKSDATLDKYQTQVQKAQNARFGIKNEENPINSYLSSALKGGAGAAAMAGTVLNPMLMGKVALGYLPVGLGARAATRTLSNPDLLQAYIKNQSLPVTRTMGDRVASAASPLSVLIANHLLQSINNRGQQ